MKSIQIQTGGKPKDSEKEFKVLQTYEIMLKSASKLICKECSVKLRPERFYEHIIHQK